MSTQVTFYDILIVVGYHANNEQGQLLYDLLD